MNKISFCDKYSRICTNDSYYYPFIKKILLISFIIIIIITIILSVGLNSENYFGWLNEIKYNPYF